MLHFHVMTAAEPLAFFRLFKRRCGVAAVRRCGGAAMAVSLHIYDIN
ncbi:hypothetical protein [Neisseria sp.]|nr:hypothetical protein [Neisseria sp.]